MKVCLVAQVENWRGGIQQYSQNYSEALVQEVETVFVGYRSYFPLWLYPGEKDKIKEGCRKWKIHVPVYNVLKFYSIYSVFNAFHKIRKQIRADIVDIQWCTTFHAPILIPLIFLLKKWSKASVVLTVHNVLPHENRFFDKPLCNLTYKLAQKLIVHSQTMKNDLVNQFGILPEKVSIIPHGICLDHHKQISCEKAKKKLGIKEQKIILFFGLVRKYKGLEYLLTAFACLKNRFGIALLIAGDFVDEKHKYEELIDKLDIKDKTYIFPQYIKDEDIPIFFSAADFVVLPYTSFSGQSGIPPTAYNFSKPVIATNVGGLPEIVIHKKTGLIVKRQDIEHITEAMTFLLKRPEKIKEYGENGKKYLETELSWENVVLKMLDIYSKKIEH